MIESDMATGESRTIGSDNPNHINMDDYFKKKYGSKESSLKEGIDSVSKSKSSKFAREKKAFIQELHNQVDREIDGDVGLQAGHAYEKGLEKTLGTVYKTAYKTYKKGVANYRAAHTPESLEAKEQIKQLKYRGQTGYKAADAAVKSESRLSGASKLQKQLYKRQRQVKMYIDRVKSTVANQNTASVISGLGKLITSALGKYKLYIFGAAAAFILLMMMYNTLTNSVLTMFTTFTTEQQEIEDTALYLTQLDADLDYRIQNIGDEPQYSHIDEVKININGVIRTDQLKATAYLSVKHDNSYSLDKIKAELEEIHNYLYTVTETEEIETRTREVTSTTINPITGLPEQTTTTESYDYYILVVDVDCKPFTSYIEQPGKLTGDYKEWYDLLMESGGNLSSLGSPFKGEDWRQRITTYFGHRVHPINGNKEMHPALDIVMPHGTEINAVHNGKAITVRRNDPVYGNYVVIWDEATDYKTMYAHCSSLLISAGEEVQKGDVIALVGNTGQSTGAHLHIEVTHKGKFKNPLFELA